jgi:hypothetical protein
MPLSTTRSIFNATSFPDRRCGLSEPKRRQNGRRLSPLHKSDCPRPLSALNTLQGRVGVIGIILIILVVLLLMGRRYNGREAVRYRHRAALRWIIADGIDATFRRPGIPAAYRKASYIAARPSRALGQAALARAPLCLTAQHGQN